MSEETPTSRPPPKPPKTDEERHEELFGERTDDQILARSLTLWLGGQDYEVPVLPIAKSRVWRKRVMDFMAEATARSTTKIDDPVAFASAMSKHFLETPEVVIDLVFDYAPNLPRDEIEAVATDGEIAKAFWEVLRTVRDPFALWL